VVAGASGVPVRILVADGGERIRAAIPFHRVRRHRTRPYGHRCPVHQPGPLASRIAAVRTRRFHLHGKLDAPRFAASQFGLARGLLAAERADRPRNAGDCDEPVHRSAPAGLAPDYPLTSFLYCHLLVYPVRGDVSPFPFETSPAAEAAARRLAGGKLQNAAKFAILGGDRSVRFWSDWFRAQPELAGWRSRNLGPFGDVEVALFERLTSSSPQPAQD
jgi:hypothetical protein